VELRKVNDDPLELDELILHVQTISGTDKAQLSRELSERCYNHLDIHPNRILFHSADEIRQLQGVGKLLKEQKLVDHRPAVQRMATETASTSASPEKLAKH
jgi:hypothetical protein